MEKIKIERIPRNIPFHATIEETADGLFMLWPKIKYNETVWYLYQRYHGTKEIVCEYSAWERDQAKQDLAEYRKYANGIQYWLTRKTHRRKYIYKMAWGYVCSSSSELLSRKPVEITEEIKALKKAYKIPIMERVF